MATIKIPDYSKIVELTPRFWKEEIGGKIKFRIKDDARLGKFQNNTKGHHYLSRQYMKYKSNNFRSLRNTGQRLKAFKGRSIESNNTAYVDMIATGDTLNGLRPIAADKTSVTMSYLSKDSMKIIGNRKLGRDLVGLSKENIKWVKEKILEQIRKNLRDINFNGQINIEVNKNI